MGIVIPSKFYRVSIKALITNDHGELLLIQERSDRWSIPGGGLEHGEDIRTGLEREVKEELGVTVASMREQPRYVWTQQTAKGTWCLALCYDVTVNSHDFVLANDVRSAQFFSAGELASLSLDPAEQKITELYQV